MVIFYKWYAIMQKSMVYYKYKHKLTRSVIPVALVNTTEMFKKHMQTDMQSEHLM